MTAVMTPPLIVHVIHRLAVGGLENGVVNLINHLPEERFRHVIVCMTQATEFSERLQRSNVPIVELHKRPGHSLALQLRFHRVFRQLRPAIVHTRNLGTLEAQLAAAVARVPVRIHGEHGWDVEDPDGSNRRYAAIRRLHAPLVHRQIALSAHIERYLRERVGIAANRVERVCNGVDCERFQPSASSRASFPHVPFRDQRFVLIGTVGRLEPVKDQLGLARAFVAALARDPEARAHLRLVIVGSGSQRTAVERVLTAGGAHELCWFAGERDDIPGLLPALDIFVLPSQAEGISNTILEAMACGVPVIATDVGGNAELVVGEETGCFVPPGDPVALGNAMLRLAADPGLRKRWGAAGRARALAKFSLAEMVRQYARLYDRELARRMPKSVAGGTGVRALID